MGAELIHAGPKWQADNDEANSRLWEIYEHAAWKK
jgi:hypothetical protein